MVIKMNTIGLNFKVYNVIFMNVNNNNNNSLNIQSV